jgi:RNA polymerase sigma factor (sigma-70 family)
MQRRAHSADFMLMTDDERELAVQAHGGDTSAFAALVRLHREGIYRIALAILGSSDEAEDVAQEAFLRAHAALRRYDPSRPFAGWLRRIAVNCALTALKRRRRNDGQVEECGCAADPSSALLRDETRRAVHLALGRLPLNQRLAITLFSLEGMDLAATAEAMGCATGTVKTHLFRARQALRVTLREYVEEAD